MADSGATSGLAMTFDGAVKAQIAAFPSARLIRRVEAGSVTMAHYHAILRTLFHQSYHGPYNMALAAVRCAWRHEAAKEFLLKHAEEESAHWRWVIDDLRATGYVGPSPRDELPHPTCEAYVSFAERVSEQAPYARLATNSVLEGIAAVCGGPYGKKLVTQLGLGKDQVTFFLNHAETDKEHVPEIEATIRACRYSDEEWRWMIHAANVAGQFYREMYDHEAFA